ncbi:MAG TPA: efflux RND transporter periplasmic adaptor subunit [Halioglobus sp.]
MTKRLSRRTVWTACAGILGIGAFLYFKSAPQNLSVADVPAVAVTVAAVVERDIPLQIQAVGTVVPFQSVAIKSRIESQIVEVRFRDGDEVKKGDVLFVLDDRTIKAELEEAQAVLVRDKAQLEDLKLQYQRNESLTEGRAISKQVVESSKFAVQAQAALVTADTAAVESLNTQLSYTQIVAPIDGRTGTITSTLGNNVKINDVPLVTINQIEPILVQSSLPQNTFDGVRRAMNAGNVAVTAKIQNSDVVVEGALAYIDNLIDRGTGTYVARSRFANSDESLWPGMLVSVTLTIGQDENAVVIPEEAVQNSYGGDFVFVAAEGKAQKRAVKVARNFNGMAIVSDGLRIGEAVVTDGLLSLADNSTVNVRSAGGEATP